MKYLPLMFFVAATGLSSCQAPSCNYCYQDMDSCLVYEGRIEQERYYDPTNTFSTALLSEGVSQIEEFSFPELQMSGVRLYGTCGALFRVEIMNIPDQAFLDLCLKDHLGPESLQSLFYHLAWAPIKNSIPNASVAEETVVDLPKGDQGYLAIVSLPEASTIANAQTGRRISSLRSYLLYYVGQKLVCLSYADDPTTEYLVSRGENGHSLLKTAVLNMQKQLEILPTHEPKIENLNH